MVKLAFFLVGFAPLGFAFTPHAEFRVEFSKSSAYVGEPVMVNFVVYSDLDSVDVEVAKFPEFRGFWKENLTLRQGPIPGSPIPGRDTYAALVGTYFIVPMLSPTESGLDPMKIALDFPALTRIEGSHPPQFLISEGTLPKVKPLPPFPRKDLTSHLSFQGAVGKFTLVPSESSLSFVKGEPAILRYSLQGHGNFQDLNTLPVEIPPEITVLSKKSSSQGGIQFSTKSFEYSILIPENQELMIPAVHFAYFDPEKEKYEFIETAPVKLVPREEVIDADKIPAEVIDWMPLYQSKSQSFEARNSMGFWGLNLIVGILFGGLVIRRARRTRQSAEKDKIPSIRTQLLTELQNARASGDLPALLSSAGNYLHYEICNRLRLNHILTTRHDALKAGEGKIDGATLAHAKGLFEIQEKLSYLPPQMATPPLTAEKIEQIINDVTGQLRK